MRIIPAPHPTSHENGPLELCASARGTALRCPCCGRAEITFGNAVLCLSIDDLDSVLRILDSFRIDDPVDPHAGRRGFVIRTQHDDAAFAFDHGEVVELHQLLTTARATLRAAPSLPRPIPGGGGSQLFIH